MENQARDIGTEAASAESTTDRESEVNANIPPIAPDPIAQTIAAITAAIPDIVNTIGEAVRTENRADAVLAREIAAEKRKADLEAFADRLEAIIQMGPTIREAAATVQEATGGDVRNIGQALMDGVLVNLDGMPTWQQDIERQKAQVRAEMESEKRQDKHAW